MQLPIRVRYEQIGNKLQTDAYLGHNDLYRGIIQKRAKDYVYGIKSLKTNSVDFFGYTTGLVQAKRKVKKLLKQNGVTFIEEVRKV